MYCKNCGKQLSDDAIMCPECGSPTKPLATIPSEKENITVAPEGDVEKINSLGAIGFFLSMFASVTSVVFGGLMYGIGGAVIFIYMIGSICILPALAGISICIFTVKKAKGGQKALAITGIVLAAIALVFLIITICIVAGALSGDL